MVRVAGVATLVALVLGTLAAAAVWRSRFFGRNAVSFLLVPSADRAPPGSSPGLALRSAIGLAEIPSASGPSSSGMPPSASWWSTTTRSPASAAPGSSLLEASMDLGANSFQTFATCCCPTSPRRFLAGGMLAFALSFDEGS